MKICNRFPSIRGAESVNFQWPKSSFFKKNHKNFFTISQNCVILYLCCFGAPMHGNGVPLSKKGNDHEKTFYSSSCLCSDRMHDGILRRQRQAL